MALGTLTKVNAYVVGNRRVRTYTVQLSSGANYTTGGETVTAAAVGLRKIEEATVNGSATTSDGSASRGIVFLFQTNGSVKILPQVSAAEVASNSDQSTFTARVTFVGF